MALFLACMSSSLMPPSSSGALITFKLTDAFLPSQTRELIIFCILYSISFGIPWTVVRYCVIPPANILTISLRDMRVGCLWSHLSKVACILSRLLDQTASSSIPFPTHPPSILIGSLYLAMWMLSGRGVPFGLICQVPSTLSRYVFVPSGNISVLFTLKRAPDARHHSSRVDSRSS